MDKYTIGKNGRSSWAGKESPRSAHANGMNEGQEEYNISTIIKNILRN
jgi:hypothetical protein